MSIVIQDENGEDVEVYVALNGGVLHAMIRATDKATFEQQAVAVGLMVHENPAIPAVLDEEGNVITPAVEASGAIKDAPYVDIAPIGEMVLATDEDGNPTETDTRYHANAWLAPRLVERNLWKKWAIMWTKYGQAVANRNADESAIVLQGIELIDPDTVRSPSNRIS